MNPNVAAMAAMLKSEGIEHRKAELIAPRIIGMIENAIANAHQPIIQQTPANDMQICILAAATIDAGANFQGTPREAAERATKIFAEVCIAWREQQSLVHAEHQVKKDLGLIDTRDEDDARERHKASQA